MKDRTPTSSTQALVQAMDLFERETADLQAQAEAARAQAAEREASALVQMKALESSLIEARTREQALGPLVSAAAAEKLVLHDRLDRMDRAHRAEISALQEKVVEAQAARAADREGAAAEKLMMQDYLARMERSERARREEIVVLQEKLAEAQETRLAAARETEVLRQSLANAQNAHAEAAGWETKLRKSATAARQEIAELRKQHSVEIDSLRLSLESGQEIYARAARKFEQAGIRFAQLSAEKEKLAQHADVATRELGRVTLLLQDCQRQLMSLKSESAEQITGMRAALARHETDGAQLAATQAALQCEVSRLADANVELTLQLRARQENHSEEKHRIQKAAADLAEQVRTLRQIHPLSDVFNYTQSEILRLESELARMPHTSPQRPELIAALTQLSAQLATIQSLIQLTHANLDELAKKVAPTF